MTPKKHNCTCRTNIVLIMTMIMLIEAAVVMVATTIMVTDIYSVLVLC